MLSNVLCWVRCTPCLVQNVTPFRHNGGIYLSKIDQLYNGGIYLSKWVSSMIFIMRTKNMIADDYGVGNDQISQVKSVKAYCNYEGNNARQAIANC